MTRIALFLGLFTPKRWMEQTNSQILHPEHRSGTTANFQDIFSSLHKLWKLKIPLYSFLGKVGCFPLPLVIFFLSKTGKGRRGGILKSLISAQYFLKCLQ